MTDAPELSYCAGEVKRQDPDRFLASLFAGSQAREALFALYAFDLEVGRIAEITSQPMTGLIRLQWWREALDEIRAGSVRRHPVVEGLAAAGPALDLDRLHAVLDGHEPALDPDPPSSLDQLDAEAMQAGGGITLAALGLLGGGAPEAEEAARHAGTAWGLLQILRATGPLQARERVRLPGDRLRQAGLSGDDVLAGQMTPALGEVVAVVLSRARHHAGIARDLRRSVPAPARGAFLHLRLFESYARALERAGHDPFLFARIERPALAPVLLTTAAYTGRW
ncbi:phytoene/squalene synthase family protein [Marinivivus vitaminiproducens]|uniref:phytoene/squalene synthase family protein n=1 Tax=Marinivivus vitaminiproducens TaxID=3035935 RepID=UPI00279E9EAB|nr:squalene/phytoene synthase family protein [Geminicoccaceae bacterium SCSIO 64248]